MDENTTRLVSSLDINEINTLLSLYYSREGFIKNFDGFDEEVLHNLVEKNLINASLGTGEDTVSLTEYGLSACGSVMVDIINVNKDLFRSKVQELPQRAVSSLINRVMWRDVISKETGVIDPITKPYALDESLWYERVLLKDERLEKMLEKIYDILEGVGFINTLEGQRWCSPEVENFLKGEYKEIMDLTWAEEDSLKYYYFFYVYAQDQKNLINFSGDGEEYRSMFFGDDSGPSDFWFSSNRSDPRSLLSSLGISESRIMGFLGEMQGEEIVNERYYPLSSFSFFSDEDKIFVISDIKSFMSYITSKFLTPVVDSLLKIS